MRTNSDMIFLVVLILTIVGLVYTISPLGKYQRPDITVKATLSK